jgi:hypothetical protein
LGRVKAGSKDMNARQVKSAIIPQVPAAPCAARPSA